MFDIKRFFENLKVSSEETLLTDTEFILKIIDEYDKSQERVNMIKGKEYYLCQNDIRFTQKYYFEDGVEKVDPLKANNKISHSFMKLLVDEKVNYFLGNNPVINSKSNNKKALERINDILNDEFLDTLNDVATECSNCGIAWLQIFINKYGQFDYLHIPSEQVIPLWCNQSKNELDAIIRYYFEDVYIGKDSKEQVMKVEYWTKDRVGFYIKDKNGKLIQDIESNSKEELLAHFKDEEGTGYGWGQVPFIPFKNNSFMFNDLHFVKDLVDEYDKRTSETSNTLDEIQELIYVLKNYGGTNLGEFTRDLKYYKTIKVDEDGGVDVLKAEINIDAIEKHLDRLKQDFYHFGQGVDMDNDKFGNNPSGVALEFIYARLKLKVASCERKFKGSFKLLFLFISKYFEVTGQELIDFNDLSVIFNKSIVTNVLDSIKACTDSSGIVSKKTLLANHPWVDDVEEELKELDEEESPIDFNKMPLVADLKNKGEE